MASASYKFKFPHFDGSNPRTWLLRALNYFKIMNIPDIDRVVIASMHFEGCAMEWFYQVSLEDREITWEHFVELVSTRFGELKETQVFTEFSKLRVKGSLEEYIQRFTQLKSHLLMFQRGNYDEPYFINSFISGLSEEMRQCFLINTPTSLGLTIETARMHEATMEGAARRHRYMARPPNSYNSTPVKRPLPTSPQPFSSPNPPAHTLQPIKKILSTAEMRARREKGLCYNCVNSLHRATSVNRVTCFC